MKSVVRTRGNIGVPILWQLAPSVSSNSLNYLNTMELEVHSGERE